VVNAAPAIPTNRAAACDPWNARAILDRIRPTLRESRSDGGTELVFYAMGTPCRIVAAGPAAAVKAFQNAAVEWVAAFEAKYSRFLPDSWISRLNISAGGPGLESDPETDRILALCHEMHFLTRGVFDPTSLPFIRLWDWKTGRVPSDGEIEAARKRVGWRKLERLSEAGMSLDLGGMGKEYAVDQVALLASRSGLGGALVDFGADIRVVGMPADGRPGWHIGLEDPAKPGSAWCGLAVNNAAVASSGDYVRRFETGGRRYGHILDVRTGRPVDNGCRAVNVLAPGCTPAGMLSTAAFVLGPVEGMKLIESQRGAEGAIHTDSKRITSRRFYEHVAS
jgi:FAD:protein FMN transferase